MALRIKGNDPIQPPAEPDEPEVIDNPEEEVAEPEAAALPQMAPSGAGLVAPDVARYLGPESVCATCIHFMEPGTCEIVAGPVDPQGRCSLYTPDAQEDPTATDVADPSTQDVSPMEPVNGSANRIPPTA